MGEKDYRFALFKNGEVKLLKFCDQIKYIIYIYLFVLRTRTATKYDDDKPIRQSACT